jgi:hypothetical protein
MGKLVSSICLAIMITAVVLSTNGIGWTQTQEEGGNKILSSVPRAPIPGIGSCAAGFTETHRIPYARSISGTCETVITCLNISNSIHDVTAQFFFGFFQSQAGQATYLDLFPGESTNLGTAATDPLGVFIMNGNAGLTGGFEGYARVCTSNPSASKALACDATLVCTGGMAGLKVIIATQKGD